MPAVRQSNLELLRIVAMFYIVLYHLICNCALVAANGFLYELSTLMLHIGVICFMLISGWFGVRFSWKGLLRLVLMCLACNTLVYIVLWAVGKMPFTLETIVTAATPLAHNAWWYFSIYVIFYLISPLLNAFLDKSTFQQKLIMLFALGIITFYFGWWANLGWTKGGKHVMNFAFVYVLGHILHEKQDTWKQWFIVRKGWLFYIFLNVSVLWGGVIANNTSCWADYKNWFFPYDSPGLIINATLFFCLFARQEIRYKRWINKIAAFVPFIYLLHENTLTEYVYRQHLSVWTTQYPFPIAFGIMIGVTFVLLIVCGAGGKILYWVINKLIAKK